VSKISTLFFQYYAILRLLALLIRFYCCFHYFQYYAFLLMTNFNISI